MSIEKSYKIDTKNDSLVINHGRRQFLFDLDIFLATSLFTTAIAGKWISKLLEEQVDRYNIDGGYKPLEPVTIEGRNFRNIGVGHTPGTLFANIKDIKKRVSNSPYVFLEYFSVTEQTLALPTTTDNELKTYSTYRDYTARFFGGIGRECAIEGKDILVVNPEYDYSHRQLQILELFLLSGLPIATSVNILAKRKLTRRTFLKTAGITLPSLIIASWLLLDKENIPGWYLIDYRDVRSSLGVRKALQSYGSEINKEQEVPMFQGNTHNGMVDYLENPDYAARRQKVYLHYQLFGNNPLRRYTFDQSENTWQLKDTIDF